MCGPSRLGRRGDDALAVSPRWLTRRLQAETCGLTESSDLSRGQLEEYGGDAFADPMSTASPASDRASAFPSCSRTTSTHTSSSARPSSRPPPTPRCTTCTFSLESAGGSPSESIRSFFLATVRVPLLQPLQNNAPRASSRILASSYSNLIPLGPQRENRILFLCVKVPADASPLRRVRELRHEHADYIAQKRAEAHEAILLLERPTAQRVAAEREKDGLIIISAHYGRAANFSDRGIRLGGGSVTGVNENGRIPVQPSHPTDHGEEQHQHPEEEEVVVDVTVPVQALVQDSRLYIPGGRAKVSRSVARSESQVDLITS